MSEKLKYEVTKSHFANFLLVPKELCTLIFVGVDSKNVANVLVCQARNKFVELYRKL